MPGAIEREIKLRFDSPDAARSAVRQLGAMPLRARRLQADAVFDTADRMLGGRGEVLRVRIEEGTHSITFKSAGAPSVMKVREELETSVGDGALLAVMLARLGLQVAFRYEKYREEFALDEVVIAVDETPVGTFVEIEGSDHGIRSTAAALGRGPSDFLRESYRDLFVQSCAESGITPTHMVFVRSTGR